MPLNVSSLKPCSLSFGFATLLLSTQSILEYRPQVNGSYRIVFQTLAIGLFLIYTLLGRQVIAVARTCKLIFIVLDVLKPLGDKAIIENELEGMKFHIPHIAYYRYCKLPLLGHIVNFSAKRRETRVLIDLLHISQPHQDLEYD